GHRYLLEAASEVMKADTRVHLVLVGDGELRGEISAQAAQLGIGPRTHLLGHRKNSALLAVAFDVAVLASLHEGLPNAVMEAMAAGTPVVATAVGGVPELIKDCETGFLVPPADAGALTRRIEFALSHTDQSDLIAMRGRRFIIERFGMERMVAAGERVDKEIIYAL